MQKFQRAIVSRMSLTRMRTKAILSPSDQESLFVMYLVGYLAVPGLLRAV
jgi:hypothetical protein